MMQGHEKSDLVIVAMKPANKAKEAHCGGVCRGERSGVGGAKGGGQGEYAPAQHVLDSEPGSRDKRAGAYTATCAVTHPRQGAVCGKAARTDPGGGRAMKRTSLPLLASSSPGSRLQANWLFSGIGLPPGRRQKCAPAVS